jgi:hypothetical protein
MMEKLNIKHLGIIGELLILLLLVCVLFVVWAPFNKHTVQGVVTEWVGNDQGFGIIMNNQSYWLSYSGSLPSFPLVLNRTYLLVYDSSFAYPYGEVNAYAHTVSLQDATHVTQKEALEK